MKIQILDKILHFIVTEINKTIKSCQILIFLSVMNIIVEKLRFLKMWYLKLVVQNKKKDKKQLCFKNSGTKGLVKEK